MKVLFLSFFIILADQVTKILVKGLSIPSMGINFGGMAYGSSKKLIGNFIRVTFIENQGLAFGLDVGPKILRVIFTIIASIVIIYFIYKYRRDSLALRISLAFILAGALGNLIDRMFYGIIYNYSSFFYGRVVDFIRIDFWDFTIFGKTYDSWPILNIADLSISIGFFLMIFFHKRIFASKKEISVLNTQSGVASDIKSSNGTELNESSLSI